MTRRTSPPASWQSKGQESRASAGTPGLQPGGRPGRTRWLPPPCSPRLVETRPGTRRHLPTEAEPERCRLRSPSPSHSLSDPNPSLRALVQEPESWSQILPHPWALFKLSLSAHDCGCQALKDESGVGCPCTARKSVTGSRQCPPARGPASEPPHGASRGRGEKRWAGAASRGGSLLGLSL